MSKATASTTRKKYQTTINSRHHSIIADEPTEVGGTDLGFKPGELLAASLASCTGITLRMYADRKKWELEEAMIDVTIDSNTVDGDSKIYMNIRLFGNLDEQQRTRLLEIAHKCPVHKMLENPIHIQTNLKD
ncbi:OsmC family protein [Flavobacterium sp.]|uniref:OsmC family protein n=1 Tax=Flavobacterium sp. TaxID=239 RepID=UPI0039E5A415